MYMYVFLGEWIHVHIQVHTEHMYVEARGQSQLSSLVTLHFI